MHNERIALIIKNMIGHILLIVFVQILHPC